MLAVTKGCRNWAWGPGGASMARWDGRRWPPTFWCYEAMV